MAEVRICINGNGSVYTMSSFAGIDSFVHFFPRSSDSVFTRSLQGDFA